MREGTEDRNLGKRLKTGMLERKVMEKYWRRTMGNYGEILAPVVVADDERVQKRNF